MAVSVMKKRLPRPATISSGRGSRESACSTLCSPSRTSGTPVNPDCAMMAAVTPLRAPIPEKSNAFSTCSRSRSQLQTPDTCCAAYDSAYRIPCSSSLASDAAAPARSEEHTSELQSLRHLVCRLLLEKKKKNNKYTIQ